MKLWLSIGTLLLLAPAVSFAQDMALSQILIEGEAWKKVDSPEAGMRDWLKNPRELPVAEVSGRSYFPVRSNPGLILNDHGEKRPLHLPIQVTGIAVWPDRGTMVVADEKSRYLYAYRIAADGTLVEGEPYYALRTRPGIKSAGTRSLTVDSLGRLYAASDLGVQVFDPTGRLSGVIVRPAWAELTRIGFGGADNKTLYVLCGDAVYGRKLQATGAYSKPK